MWNIIIKHTSFSLNRLSCCVDQTGAQVRCLFHKHEIMTTYCGFSASSKSLLYFLLTIAHWASLSAIQYTVVLGLFWRSIRARRQADDIMLPTFMNGSMKYARLSVDNRPLLLLCDITGASAFIKTFKGNIVEYCFKSIKLKYIFGYDFKIKMDEIYLHFFDDSYGSSLYRITETN